MDGVPSVESIMVPSKSSRNPAKTWDAVSLDTCVSRVILPYSIWVFADMGFTCFVYRVTCLYRKPWR